VVCACTFRRPAGLQSLLEGLAQQQFESVTAPAVSLIIVDNECNQANQEICNQAASELGLDILYLQQVRRGITYARNTYLDNLPADADFIALIDDDEVPSEHWLDQLLMVQQQTGGNVIAGPALAQFPQAAPHWLVGSGYFDIPFQPGQFANLQASPPVATCNALLQTTIFRDTGIRFDNKLARCGSEDAMLFQDLKLRGYRFFWAANAIVHETVSDQRATIGYALREAFRRGSTRFYIKCQLKASKTRKKIKLGVRMTLRSVFRLVKNGSACLFYTLSGKAHRPEAVLYLIYATENMGELAGIAGLRKRHY
jgi:succinoglycan biosynthesis protein ExoM